jgi:hypothetical protein
MAWSSLAAELTLEFKFHQRVKTMHNAWNFPPNFFIEYFSLQTSAKIIQIVRHILKKTKRTIKSYGSAARLDKAIVIKA